MRRLLLATLLAIGCVHTAQAGGIIDLDDLLARVVTLEADVRILQSDARLVPPRLDELDARIQGLDARIDDDYEKAQETANRVANESARNDVQAGRLNGHDARLDLQAQRLDLIPTLVRCMLPPLAYRHVSVRTAKGKKVTALVPTKAPIGFKPGVYWLARINADCVKRLP